MALVPNAKTLENVTPNACPGSANLGGPAPQLAQIRGGHFGRVYGGIWEAFWEDFGAHFGVLFVVVPGSC